MKGHRGRFRAFEGHLDCLYAFVHSWMCRRDSWHCFRYMSCTHSCRHRSTYQAFVMLYTHRDTPIHSGHAHDGKASRLQVQQETYVIALVVAWEQAHSRHRPVCDFLCALPSLLLTAIKAYNRARHRRWRNRVMHLIAASNPLGRCFTCIRYDTTAI